MTFDPFDQFAVEAAELFGLDQRESAHLLGWLEAEGFDLETDSLYDGEWGAAAADVFEDVVDTEQYDFPRYELAAEAAELFGLDQRESANLFDALEAAGFDLEADSLYDDEWGAVAADVFEDIVDTEQYGFPEYELDQNWEWGDDAWIEAGEEIEVSLSYGEDT